MLALKWQTNTAPYTRRDESTFYIQSFFSNGNRIVVNSLIGTTNPIQHVSQLVIAFMQPTVNFISQLQSSYADIMPKKWLLLQTNVTMKHAVGHPLPTRT